jgi:hypothetical protein
MLEPSWLTKEALPYLWATKGSIVNISSASHGKYFATHEFENRLQTSGSGHWRHHDAIRHGIFFVAKCVSVE